LAESYRVVSAETAEMGEIVKAGVDSSPIAASATGIRLPKDLVLAVRISPTKNALRDAKGSSIKMYVVLYYIVGCVNHSAYRFAVRGIISATHKRCREKAKMRKRNGI
jgi:hypothetical protein